MAVEIGLGLNPVAPPPGFLSSSGALLSNPVGWVGLGVSMLMAFDAQERANAQRTEAYNIATTNLLMQRDQELAKGQREVISAQDQIVEKSLENMLTAMQEGAKVKSAAKGKMNTGNMLRLIKSGELQGNTKLNQAWHDLIRDYNTQSDNLFKRTDAEIKRLANEYAQVDKTNEILLETIFGAAKLAQLGIRTNEVDKYQQETKSIQNRMIQNERDQKPNVDLKGRAFRSWSIFDDTQMSF